MATNNEDWVASYDFKQEDLTKALNDMNKTGAAGTAAKSYLSRLQDIFDNEDKKNRERQYNWMYQSGAFAGWSDDQINSFRDQWNQEGWTNKEAAAAQMWQNTNIGVAQANEQKKQDRADILAEIEAYKNGFSNENIAVALAAERQAWDGKISSTLREAQNQAAAQGRTIDASTYALLRGRLEAQAATAMQQVQMNYEAKRLEYAKSAIDMKNSVYQNTANTVMTYQDLAQVISALAGSGK